MINNPNIQPIGYTEMYEWMKCPDLLRSKSGLFVQFNSVSTDKIEPYWVKKEEETGLITIPEFCGISSATATEISDNPQEWHNKYVTDEYGMYIVQQKYIAVGNKEYDQHNELSFIRTFPYSVYKKQETEEFNSERQYTPRSKRIEWQNVCLLGKAIVIDNGNCKPGEYIVPYTGNEYDLAGTGVKYDSTLGIHQKLPKFYVLKRISEKTVQVLVR